MAKERKEHYNSREIGFHVEIHATQWHGFQHEIQFQEIGVAWIQPTLYFRDIVNRKLTLLNTNLYCAIKSCPHFLARTILSS